ncbi:hypothetical protein TorRG33x02_224980 [Trema orientale]|uniref:Uncharacterized protein n=1 Tax=Trema orientale TaxID=63057 RepID=A0A2P5E7Z9_TREOI|nr:hypothetical protein TorRG33x02_224980 [Trema orientale]
MTSQSCMLIMGEEKLMYLFLVSLNLVQHPKLKGICQGIKVQLDCFLINKKLLS